MLRCKLIEFKVTHRLQYSKTKLTQNLFPRCVTDAEGSLTYIFWLCPHLLISNVGVKYFRDFLVEKGIAPDPELALFGLLWTTLSYTCQEQLALMLGMVVHRK